MLFPYLSVLLPCKTLEESGLNVTMEDVPNTDHFSIIEQLVDGEYHLTKVHLKHKQLKVLVTMKLGVIFLNALLSLSLAVLHY